MTKSCPTCKGTGWIEDENYGRDCHKCNGSGTIKLTVKKKKKYKPSYMARDTFHFDPYA